MPWLLGRYVVITQTGIVNPEMAVDTSSGSQLGEGEGTDSPGVAVPSGSQNAG